LLKKPILNKLQKFGSTESLISRSELWNQYTKE